ncbi:MAG TPA: hypothetical protein VEL76_08150 [Gemmataceae bacterium]|nr:hypothetical protein [Gemmataceae bacterium]
MPRSKLLRGLIFATGAALLVLVGFLIASPWNRSDPPKPGTPEANLTPGAPPIRSTELPNPPPPPPPPPPKAEVRFKENLKAGKTYEVTTEMVFTMRGKHRDYWVIKADISMNYRAVAVVERKIEANDGQKIVELRTFKMVRATCLETPLKLESVRIDLGLGGDIIVGGASILKPELAPVLAGGRKVIEGVELRGIANQIGLDQTILNRADKVLVVTSMGRLEGKTVRLTYRAEGDRGVVVEAVTGDLTPEEYRFLAASVLPADAYLFPDMEVAKGASWQVDGGLFVGMIDPSLLARTEGKVALKRADEDRFVVGRKVKCIPVLVTSGNLNFVENTRKAAHVGNLRIQKGEMLFAPDQQMFIAGVLQGKGDVTIRSTDHVIFEARSDLAPQIFVSYKCKLMNEP